MQKLIVLLSLVLQMILSGNCVRQADNSANPSAPPPTGTKKIERVATQQFYAVGLSAGGFMASQMGVAYSSLFSGVGVFAGGIYGCSLGSLINATLCVQNAGVISAENYVQWARNSASLGLIDSLDGIANQRVFVYAGSNDRVVDPAQEAKIVSFYESLGASSVIGKVLPNAGHGIPTLNYGTACADSTAPWFTNCAFDGAGAAIGAMIPGVVERGAALPESLSSFEQAPFITSNAQMAETGYVYTPAACKNDPRQCSVLIAFHGCEQSTDLVGSDFAVHSGFSDWAESNHLIVIYPSVRKTASNPDACWDWWGYTGANFANRQAPQIQSVYRMMERFSRAP